ncbi:hypothetical protein P43SY_001810 [Pythium insidiosum]|uniref:Peptidase M28 domain-containing protein n=1 Tax=Pythium insidiosum TaxID=114742 RepID=A0AAD5LLD0_PYTIN|nr:hypothetical protein P43SY_001810 [Pythium insidiosum]
MGDLRQRRGGHGLPADAVSEPKVSSFPSDDGLRKRRRGSHHTSVPKVTPLVIGFVLFYALFLATVGHYHTWLPDPRGLDAPSDVFSEARSRVVLDTIMSFGYRPVGSKANDELTPQYLLSQINEIKSNAVDDVRIEIDVQRPTGAFGLNFLEQFQNIYANVTNIVVRVSSATPDGREDANGTDALLISSHYDAAIGAGAASDDGVSIAIMVELLRYYSRQPPKHAAIVFNFNGAEETILQAAHGFITQHKWTQDIRAFINLEAAGAGGRELLFQTGSDELALAYAEGAKYPHASIIAQEVFQTGVIPADTDFRIYRDFGAIAGMDFAYIANGYVYHTRLDDTSRIQPGAIQRLGDNLVGVIHHLVNEPATNRRKIHLHFTGPAFLHIYIDAKKTRLTSWSIGEGVNGPVPSTEGTYILQFATGIPPASFHFWIEAESNAPIEIGLTGHFLEERTTQMQEFLDALPSWVHVAEIVSTWRSQVI